MKLGLINMPSKGIAHKQNNQFGQTQYNEPIGLLNLAAYVKEKGFHTEIIDMNTIKTHYISKEDFLEIIIDNTKEFDYIGLGTFSGFKQENLDIAKAIKKTNQRTKVIFGGPHSTFEDTEGLLEGFVDFIVRKEGEETLTEILQGKDKTDIKGITYADQGKIIRTADRPFMRNLDLIPNPARELISTDYYTIGKRLNLSTARGCPGKCVYCVSPAMWESITRFRSPESIEHEITDFFDRYGPLLPDDFHINITDDTFPIRKERAKMIAKIIAKTGRPWYVNSTASAAPKDILKTMYENGCTKIKFGLESGSQRVLNLMNKKQNLEQMKQAIEDSKSIGYITQASFIIGSPTETEEEIIKTIEFAKQIPLDFAYFFISTPYPGTDLTSNYVPKKMDIFNEQEKFNATQKIFGEYDMLTPLKKTELLCKAYFEFYVVGKGMQIDQDYYQLSDSFDKIGYIQSQSALLHKEKGSYSGITNFLSTHDQDIPARLK